MVSHHEWYQQRYKSAEGVRKQRKAAKLKTERDYQELKEKYQSRQEQGKENAEIIFAEYNLPYQVIRKGMWLVNAWGQEIYYYPTTNRWRVKGKTTTYYSRGVLDFLEKVWKYQNPEEYF